MHRLIHRVPSHGYPLTLSILSKFCSQDIADRAIHAISPLKRFCNSFVLREAVELGYLTLNIAIIFIVTWATYKIRRYSTLTMYIGRAVAQESPAGYLDVH
jgi:hypothetical protein